MTKILLVEDDKSLREIYGVRLLAEGYDIVSAGDGEAALAMAIKERPQLIVSDVMMPKISGFDMLDILRSTTETRDIKVIMMTALSSEDQRARGEALGADRYLVKSQVGIEDVVRTVHDVLGDAPVSSPSAQSFGGVPAPTAARPVVASPQPAPPPTAVAEPAVAQTIPVAVAPAPIPAPVFVQPATLPAPVAEPTPIPQFTPAAAQVSSLPQPTAPFSTARPTNLGERVIHPLQPSETDTQDMAALISQELSNHVDVAPSFAPNPTPIAPQPIASPVPVDPQPALVGAQPPTPPLPGISFEETPRPVAPSVPSPFGAQPPQQ